jgi:Tfp pilus assembly protein PilE
MKRILQSSFFKCIGPENKSGITFVEVVVVGVLVPLVVRNVKNYVTNVERNTENQDGYLA